MIFAFVRADETCNPKLGDELRDRPFGHVSSFFRMKALAYARHIGKRDVRKVDSARKFLSASAARPSGTRPCTADIRPRRVRTRLGNLGFPPPPRDADTNAPIMSMIISRPVSTASRNTQTATPTRKGTQTHFRPRPSEVFFFSSRLVMTRMSFSFLTPTFFEHDFLDGILGPQAHFLLRLQPTRITLARASGC